MRIRINDFLAPGESLVVTYTMENSWQHLAVAGVEDHVPRVGVDSDDPGDRALDPRLLECLADRRLGDRLAEDSPKVKPLFI
jgi:hypothetical protein